LQDLDEFLEILGGKLGIDLDHVGYVGKISDRDEVLQWIIRQVLGSASRIDGQGGYRGDGEGVTIRLGTGGLGCAYGTARAALVFDHNGLPQFFTHALGNDTGDDVGRTTRSEGHDDPDRLRRVIRSISNTGAR